MLRCAALLLVLCSVAHAEPERPWAVGVPVARQNKALEIFKAGNGMFEESRHAPALAKYREALALWDHPSIRYNIAVCLIHLDQPLQAFESLEVALRYGESALGGEVHRQALTYKKLLLGQLARLSVGTKEPGAEVLLDGERLVIGPGVAERLVLPGVHQLVAAKRGFLTETRSPTLLPGKKTELDLHLVPLGTLTKTTHRWPTWKPWVVFGAGLLVAAIGIPLLLDGRATVTAFRTQFDASCPNGCKASDQALAFATYDRGQAEQSSATVMFAVGGAIVASAVVLLILNQPRVVSADRGQLAFRF